MSLTSSAQLAETISLETLANVEQDVGVSHREIFSRPSATPSVSEAAPSPMERQSDAGSHAVHPIPLSLAPADKGFGAWSYLAGAFLVEASIWSFPNSYGVFLSAYLKDGYFGSQPSAHSLLPLVGTLSSGIIYCSGPVIYPFISRYPRYRRPSMFLGIIVCWASLFGASFADKVWKLVLLQGATYGIGASLLYAPCISYMPEWFVQRRGLANGVVFAGTAVGGIILPIRLPFLLHKYGPPATLRILSIPLLALLVIAVPFVRGRLPDARVHGPVARDARSVWMTDRVFWVVVLANTIQGFAYFVPILWLPNFASSLSIGDMQSSLVVSLFNGGPDERKLVRRLSYGALSDHLSPWMLGISSLLLTSLSTFIIWGVLSTSLWGLLVYGIAYGTLAGGWTSLWTGFVRPIAKDDPTLATTIFSILMLSRGLGNVLSTPISTSLLRPSNDAEGHQFGYRVDGGKFQNMIFYVGSVFAGAGTTAAIGWVMDARRRQTQAAGAQRRGS